MKPKAYSYLRFSTPEQMKGDSFRRQAAMAEEYAARHGLDLDTELTFRDLGVSAFRGRNARQGALGAFLRAVDEGAVAEGSFLLVENLDRVSRQDPWEALPIFQQIINAGITIVSLQDDRTYSRAEMRANPWKIMESLMFMVRAHDESDKKSRRLAEAWKGKRAKVAEKPLTSRAVAWVERDPSTGGFRLIPERAEVVRRIFAMTLEGRGQNLIAQALNREGVPTFGDNGTKRKAGMWHRSYVAKILGNPAAMGTMVPHVVDHATGRKVRKPLDPVPGYYPAAVDAETFQAVQAMKAEAGRKAPVVRGGEAVGPRFILASLAKCPECGGSMTRKSPGSRPKSGRPVLICAKAKAGAGCRHVSVQVDRVEAALLAALPELGATVPAGDEGLDAALAAAEVRLSVAYEARDNILAAIERGDPSPTLTARLRALDGEAEAAEAEVRELARQAATATAEAAARRIEAAERAAAEEPRDPGKINAALRQAFLGVVVDYRTGHLRCQWRHGGESEVRFAWPKDAGDYGEAA